MEHHRRKGKVDDLLAHIGDHTPAGTLGIGHTRWATHGAPNDANAHPHLSGDGQLALIHNGIIENYHALKETLANRGHVFHSDTDTEVLVHLIEEVLKSSEELDLFEATRIALDEVVGAYAIAVMDVARPDELVLARKSSPLVIGIGEGNTSWRRMRRPSSSTPRMSCTSRTRKWPVCRCPKDSKSAPSGTTR